MEVATVEELQRSNRKRTPVHGRDIIIFLKRGKNPNDASSYCAMDAVCYRKNTGCTVTNAFADFGGPLSEGDIEDLNGHQCIVCPWHRYPISLDTGECFLRERGSAGVISKVGISLYSIQNQLF